MHSEINLHARDYYKNTQFFISVFYLIPKYHFYSLWLIDNVLCNAHRQFNILHAILAFFTRLITISPSYHSLYSALASSFDI